MMWMLNSTCSKYKIGGSTHFSFLTLIPKIESCKFLLISGDVSLQFNLQNIKEGHCGQIEKSITGIHIRELGWIHAVEEFFG